MTTHHLTSTRDTVRDVFSRDHPPVLTVDPGDRVIVETLDASGYLRPQAWPGEAAPRLLPAARGHCLIGPVHVRGAHPGQVLAVQVEWLTCGAWGWTAAATRQTPLTRQLGLPAGDPAWLLWQIDPVAGTARTAVGPAPRQVTVNLAPFLGVMGMAPNLAGEHSTVPPRTDSGGNIDCRELVAGSTLYLPVKAPGAGLYLGDGHAAQGDGEVAGTAVECPMTAAIVLQLQDSAPVIGVHAVTPDARLTFGFDANLNVAAAAALAAMVDWIALLTAAPRATALALASPLVDLRVTQVANDTWGVHARLPHGAGGLPEPPTGPSVRPLG